MSLKSLVMNKWLWLVFLGLGLFLVSCSEVQYYAQAVSGHLDILDRKQDIRTLIESKDTPTPLVQKLKLLQDVREFAIQELGLPDVNSYTSYADVGRPYVSTIVTAAPPLQLSPYQWCYLFVGCVGYRGYFSPEEAKAFANELSKQGYDVALGRVRAYSTLGWLNNSFMPDYFKDPVLNTFVDRAEITIIRTLIHEMAHQIVFVSDDTAFNESFAVFVEKEGARQYLFAQHQNAEELYNEYLHRKTDRSRFIELVRSYVERLQQLYESELTEEEKLQKKAEIFEEMRTTYQKQASEYKVLNYERWFERPLNNAHLMGVRFYSDYVSAFERMFEEAGRQWPAFYEKVKEIADFSKEARTMYLEERLAK